MPLRTPPMHLARCAYCSRRIAWSRRRRHWLSLAPVVEMPGSKLGRRITCPETGGYHDPQISPYERLLARLGVAR